MCGVGCWVARAARFQKTIPFCVLTSEDARFPARTYSNRQSHFDSSSYSATFTRPKLLMFIEELLNRMLEVGELSWRVGFGKWRKTGEFIFSLM